VSSDVHLPGVSEWLLQSGDGQDGLVTGRTHVSIITQRCPSACHQRWKWTVCYGVFANI